MGEVGGGEPYGLHSLKEAGNLQGATELETEALDSAGMWAPVPVLDCILRRSVLPGLLESI